MLERENIPRRTFREALREVMFRQEIGPTTLAQVTGLTPQQISAYRAKPHPMRKPPEPDLANLRKIALALNVSTDWLLGLDPSPEPTPMEKRLVPA